MSVVADLELKPGLDEVRELAAEHNLVPLRHTFIADCETPVSAYLKLRGGGPSFLLESAEQGQRVGRWSFLGFHPRTTIRMSLADRELAGRKVEEEAEEVARAARDESDERVAEEAADVLYHLSVLLAGRGVELADVYEVLNGRGR